MFLYILLSLTVLFYRGSGIDDLMWCEPVELSDKMMDCRNRDVQVEVLRSSTTTAYYSGFVDYEQFFLDAKYCNELDAYTTQLTCHRDAIHECLKDDYKGLLPDKYSLIDAFTNLCNNHLEMNDQCMRDYLNHMADCLLSRGFDNPGAVDSTDENKNMCKLYSYARNCVLSTLRPCGPAALAIYRTTIDFLKPVTCHGVSVSCGNIVLLLLTLAGSLVMNTA